jgi:cytochrome c-type biogenesis protein CcmH
MRPLLALMLALLLAAPAAAAEPRASLTDIEDEVMCLECGTALNVSNSEVADQQRDFIAELIAQGKTKDEVKDALVAEYGPRVLAEPADDGFQLTAWLVPVLAALAALALVVVTARRWRGTRPAAAEPGPDRGLDPEDARRLDAELAAFDR